MDKMDKKEANRLIAEKVAAAHAAIKEAEEIADKAGVSFSFSNWKVWQSMLEHRHGHQGALKD